MAVDPAKRQAVTGVVRQHPAMSLVAVSPGIVVFGLLWWLTNPFLAILFGIVAVAGGYYLLTRRS
ncbi:hypothetical protein QSJ19_23685 [Gordonia sp. ABSL11-1]|uniref:hypothetical protein n=1 Tax=Gordonia sp. ABSL11-1 TaxID=3053924 RepID=UPI002573CC3B|nr:hypothetical protein [Gordonia sp. ABSL11-1]MDL9948530.1 hypothetical protein [Gordonia sp. ABSL11-1]